MCTGSEHRIEVLSRWLRFVSHRCAGDGTLASCFGFLFSREGSVNVASNLRGILAIDPASLRLTPRAGRKFSHLLLLAGDSFRDEQAGSLCSAGVSETGRGIPETDSRGGAPHNQTQSTCPGHPHCAARNATVRQKPYRELRSSSGFR